jgi:beta-glucuronidase
MPRFSNILARGLIRCRNAFLFFAVCAVIFPAIAQRPMKTLLVGIDHRSIISLDGDWHLVLLPVCSASAQSLSCAIANVTGPRAK